MKIAELVALADRLGAAEVATGHYARMGRTADGIPFIREGLDGTKDQSYFLYATKRAELERLCFPLGESTKVEVRAEAVARKLPGATKGESQELCFVGGGQHAYTAFVEERAKERLRPGPIVDRDGRRVGLHDGVHRFTIGQRKGIGVALGKPMFVTSIDADTATVRLGRRDGPPLGVDRDRGRGRCAGRGIAARCARSHPLPPRRRPRPRDREWHLVPRAGPGDQPRPGRRVLRRRPRPRRRPDLLASSSCFGRVLVCVAALGVAAVVTPACSQGEGTGKVTGTLNIPDCWNGSFDLEPDFFAASPYNSTLNLKIQRGSDFEDFSDGVALLVDDITKIRPNAGAKFVGLYNTPMEVDIPIGVAAPGTPVVPDPNPAIVHFALYMQSSCKTQTVSLNAVDVVTLPTDGTCTAPAIPGGDPTQGCAAGKSADAGLGTGKSTISFSSLSDGDLTEEVASARLNQGCFDIYLADPRDAVPGSGVPPICRGHLRGTFSFYFERGRPAQAFP